MITQYDHILQSSFYLWFEYQLSTCGNACATGKSITFYAAGQGPLADFSNSSSYFPDVPAEMISYNSPYRQFLALEDVSPDPDSTLFSPTALAPRISKHVTIAKPSSAAALIPEFPDAQAQKDQVIIDYKNGRVLLDKNEYGSNSTVTGNFNVKTFNTYFTSEEEESLLINSDFIIRNDSLKTFLESKFRLKDKTFTIPAGFVTISKSKNKLFAIGGPTDTSSSIAAVIVANTNYELDFALSLFRDKARVHFPVVPFEDFPYGEFFAVKTGLKPYKYNEYIKPYAEKVFIQSVRVNKLSDKASKRISKDLKVGFIDFEVSSVRRP